MLEFQVGDAVTASPQHGTKTKEIPCVDEVNETQGTFKWSDKAKDALKKMNSDCNLTSMSAVAL